MFRVLRLDRMFEFFNKTETRTNFPNAFRITKVIYWKMQQENVKFKLSQYEQRFWTKYPFFANNLYEPRKHGN